MKDVKVGDLTAEDLIRWQSIIITECAIRVNPRAFSAAETLRNQMEEIRFKSEMYARFEIDTAAAIGISAYSGAVFILDE